MRRPEQAIHLAVAEMLRWRAAPGVVWWHHPGGGYRRPAEARILQELGARPGIPDLLLLKGGELFCLELKSKIGRLSPAQVAMHAELRAAGATVTTAASVDAAIEQLHSWGLLQPNRVRLPYADNDREPVGKFSDMEVA